jgi:hypothetical protein
MYTVRPWPFTSTVPRPGRDLVVIWVVPADRLFVVVALPVALEEAAVVADAAGADEAEDELGELLPHPAASNATGATSAASDLRAEPKILRSSLRPRV